MGYVIWGTGVRGLNIYRYISKYVSAFIESDITKIGNNYDGKPIVGISEYQRLYIDEIIIVSPMKDEEIVNELKRRNINHFFTSNDCPWEFVVSYEPTIVSNIVCSINHNKGIYIYGLSLFSVLLAVALSQSRRKCIIISEDDNKELEIKVFKDNGITIKKMLLKDIDELDLVLVASGRKNKFVESKVLEGKWIDVFYLSNLLPTKYKNEALNKFKGIHGGERCFIVATGPSIRIEDLEKLNAKQEICISMNKIFYSFDQTLWRPNYYMGEDSKLLKYYNFELKNEICCEKFIADTYDYIIDNSEKCYKYHVSFSDRKRRAGGYYSFEWGYSCGYSVLVGSLYLAIFMGFSEIYLIGADFNYSNNLQDINNHFYLSKDKIGLKNKEVYSEFYLDVVLESLEYVKKIADSRGIKIINATRGGNLNIFDRVNFDELINQ